MYVDSSKIVVFMATFAHMGMLLWNIQFRRCTYTPPVQNSVLLGPSQLKLQPSTLCYGLQEACSTAAFCLGELTVPSDSVFDMPPVPTIDSWATPRLFLKVSIANDLSQDQWLFMQP